MNIKGRRKKWPEKDLWPRGFEPCPLDSKQKAPPHALQLLADI